MKNHKNVLFTLVLLTISTLPFSAMACTGSSADSFDCLKSLGAQTPSDQAEIWRREQQQSNQAEAQRQWQIREDAVQARIAKHRATPAYGAIVVSEIDSALGWGGGYTTKEKATQRAMNACKAGNCKVLLTFSNTCAGMASLLKNSKDPNAIVVATDPNPRTALGKALRQCEAKYGKDTCGMLNNEHALCTGYDYALYGVE